MGRHSGRTKVTQQTVWGWAPPLLTSRLHRQQEVRQGGSNGIIKFYGIGLYDFFVKVRANHLLTKGTRKAGDWQWLNECSRGVPGAASGQVLHLHWGLEGVMACDKGYGAREHLYQWEVFVICKGRLQCR